jgi:hypothetical protein
MSHHDKTYVIVPFSEVTQAMIDACLQTSFDTLRHSIEGEDRVVLKWESEHGAPEGMEGYDTYTHAQIKVIMATEDWSSDEEGDMSSSSSGI